MTKYFYIIYYVTLSGVILYNCTIKGGWEQWEIEWWLLQDWIWGLWYEEQKWVSAEQCRKNRLIVLIFAYILEEYFG